MNSLLHLFLLQSIIKMSKRCESANGVDDSQNNCKRFLKELSLKCVKQAERLMDETAVAFLRAKYECSLLQNNRSSFIDFFVAYILEQLDSLKEKQSTSQSRAHSQLAQEYDILEQAMQKSESQIRKHIRIEQQCKIHIDNLEEQVSSLQKLIKQGQNKCLTLIETIKHLEKENQHLQEKLDQNEGNSGKQQPSHEAIMLSKLQKDAFVSWKQKRPYKMKNTRHQASGSQLEIIDVKSNNKLSIKQYRKKQQRPDIQLKQIIKAFQMKESIEKRKNSKSIKYKTSLPSQSQAKLYRSNSVCN